LVSFISKGNTPGVGMPINVGPSKPIFTQPGQDQSPKNPNYGSHVDLSYMKAQLEKSRQAEARANQAYKALKAEHNDALKQLSEVDNRINAAVAANNKMHSKESPMESYSKMQMKTLKSMGIGSISNRQSFGLAGLTILLGITAIIGRVE
jgi:hypothetical protein